MKFSKTKTALAIASVLGAGAAQAAITHTLTNGSFDFYDATQTLVPAFGHNDVQGTFDLMNGTGAFTTSTVFSGVTWVADINAIDFYNPTNANHTYSWTVETWFIGTSAVTCRMAGNIMDGCDDEAVSGGMFLGSGTGNYSYQLTNAGQFGVHTFFDWSGNYDIPVLAVLQVTAGNPMTGPATVVSVDSDGDGVPGHQMLTQPFPGQTPAFGGVMIPVSAIPVPAAVWLFGSGLLGLVGVARRKKA